MPGQIFWAPPALCRRISVQIPLLKSLFPEIPQPLTRYDVSMESAAAIDPSWVAVKDEELLNVRICDLGVRIEGSELERRVGEFYDELSSRGVALRPDCYVGDEWFSPEGGPAIAIPFYLAHPRLKALELRQMLEVEGGTPEWCQQLLG